MSKLTYEQVAAVADQLDANGTKPTAIKVREVLGRGSYSTITAFLEQWQPQESDSEIPVVPESLIQLLPAIWSACYREAFKHAETQVESIRLDFEVSENAKKSAMRAVDELEKRLEQLETENQRLSSVADARQSMIDALYTEIKDLNILLSQRDGLIQGLKESLSALNPTLLVAEPEPKPESKTEPQAEQVNANPAEQRLEELAAQYPHLFQPEGIPKSVGIHLGKLINPADETQSWNGKGKPPAWYADVLAVYGDFVKPPYRSARVEGGSQ